MLLAPKMSGMIRLTSMITIIDQPLACREDARMDTDDTPIIVPTIHSKSDRLNECGL